MSKINPRVDIAFAKGLERGIAQGIEQGKIEERLFIAKNLLKAGVSVQIVALTSGLTSDQIKALSELEHI